MFYEGLIAGGILNASYFCLSLIFILLGVIGFYLNKIYELGKMINMVTLYAPEKMLKYFDLELEVGSIQSISREFYNYFDNFISILKELDDALGGCSPINTTLNPSVLLWNHSNYTIIVQLIYISEVLATLKYLQKYTLVGGLQSAHIQYIRVYFILDKLIKSNPSITADDIFYKNINDSNFNSFKKLWFKFQSLGDITEKVLFLKNEGKYLKRDSLKDIFNENRNSN